MLFSDVTKRRTRLVLPAPDGAEITNKWPAGSGAASLNILNLFPHLLDQHLELY